MFQVKDTRRRVLRKQFTNYILEQIHVLEQDTQRQISVE